MGILAPKRVAEMPNYEFGICLWKLPTGSYIQDRQQNYLNCFGRIGDKMIEMKMRKAARECGVEGGEPQWLPGFRRVTQGEWEDQMAELQDGGIPDPVDVYRQDKYGV